MTNTPIAATEGGLLPCPRCGSKAFVTVDFQVWCEVDRCLRLPPRACRYDAILAWNQRDTRTPAPSLGEDVVERACDAAADYAANEFGDGRKVDWRAERDADDFRKFIGHVVSAALSSMRPVQEEGVGEDGRQVAMGKLYSLRYLCMSSGQPFQVEVIDEIIKALASRPEASPPSLGVEELREALEPFATCWTDEELDGAPDEMSIEEALYGGSQPTVGDLRKARAALSRVSGGV